MCIIQMEGGEFLYSLTLPGSMIEFQIQIASYPTPDVK